MTLQEVIDHNTNQQHRARELNLRAGLTLFVVLTIEQMAAWLKQQLGGATCAADIQDIEALRLPSLDAALMEQVEKSTPGEVEVQIRKHFFTFPVEYGEAAPLIHIENLLEGNRWLDLPDEGITLPNGREVAVSMRCGGAWGHTVSDVSMPEFKEKVRAELNRHQWDDWHRHNGLDIPLPDFAEQGASIPAIKEMPYGRCEIDGQLLVAYGTLVVNPHKFYQSDPWFITQWFQSRKKAQEARNQALEKLEEMRDALQQEQAFTQAQEVERQLNKLYSDNLYKHDLPLELKNQLQSCLHNPDRQSTTTVRRWTEDGRALIIRVQTALKEKKAAPPVLDAASLSGLFGGQARVSSRKR